MTKKPRGMRPAVDKPARAAPIGPINVVRGKLLSSDGKSPVWSLQVFDAKPVWMKEENLTLHLLAKLQERFAKLERMTWSEIEGHESHFVPVEDLSKAARDRLTDLGHETDELFSVRVNSAIRVWGIREAEIFRILWLDPKHEVCPSSTYKA